MNVSVVIAAWNERENLEALTRRLQQTLTGTFELEIVYVIAGDDGTRAIAERLQPNSATSAFSMSRSAVDSTPHTASGFAAVPDDMDVVVTGVWMTRWMRAANVSGTTEIVGPYLLFRPAQASSFKSALRACPQ